MSNDFLLDPKLQTVAKTLRKSLNLKLSLPRPLERSFAPWVEQPLAGMTILLGGDGEAHNSLEASLKALGASVTASAEGKVDGIVVDATAASDAASLRVLYDTLNPSLRSLNAQGRVVVVARPVDKADSPVEAAARRGIEGFVRSLAKELGRKGGAAQLLEIQDGIDEWANSSLAFLLSKRSAFISGQSLRLAKRSIRSSDKPERFTLANSLEGKVALVTGGARGIGAETAIALAAEGAQVVILDRPQEAAAANGLAQQLGGDFIAADVSDPDAPAEITHSLLQLHGGVDIVVHNAGITRDKTLARMKPEAWDLVLDINFAAILRIDEALLAGPLRPGGRLIYLSSVGGIAGNMGQTNYATTKAGLIGYVDALARQLSRRGITTNAIAPGFIETKMTAVMPTMLKQAARRLSNLNQGGHPGDVAAAITFLAHPGAQPITGKVLRVCGGSLIGA